MSLTIRRYRPSDYAAVLRIWRAGFEELAPDVYASIAPPVAAALGAGAALAFALHRRTTGCALAASAALLLSRAGLWLLTALLRRGIDRQAAADMTPEALAEGVWSTPSSAFWVAESASGEVIGCVGVKGGDTLHKERADRSLGPLPGEASVWRLSVDARARRLGAARALMAAAAAWAAARGVTRVSLICGNAASKRAYARMGYAPISAQVAESFIFRGAPRAGLSDAMRRQMLASRTRRGNILAKAVGGKPGEGQGVLEAPK